MTTIDVLRYNKFHSLVRQHRFLVVLLILSLCFLFILPPSRIVAQDNQSGVRWQVQAGYDGQYRVGSWFPVTVTISNDGADMQGVLEWSFPGQRGSNIFRQEIDLPRGAQKRLIFGALSSDFARSGELQLLSENALVIEERFQLDPIDTDIFVVGVMSSDSALLNSLAAMVVNNFSSTRVLHLESTQMPNDPLLLSGMDALFVHDITTADWSEAQRAALELWVQLGGQLVVSGGTNAEQTVPGLVDILPVTVGDLTGDVALTSLDQILRFREDMQQTLPESATASRVDLLPGAQALDDQQLITIQAFGAGQVVFCAFDVSRLRAWTGEPNFWSRVLRSAPRVAPANYARWQGNNVLRSVLQLRELQLPSFGVLVLFILVYILIIGPLNFIVLRRLRRAELAWFTVPVIVVLFVSGTYGVSFTMRGNRAQLRQVAVVQGFEGYARGQATAFVGVFSPQRNTYDVMFDANTLVSEERFNTSNPAMIAWTDENTSLPDVLVDVSALRTFIVERPVDVPLQVQSNLQRDGQQVVGELRNEGDEPLTDALLVQGSAVQELGTLQPGEQQQVTLRRNNSNFPDRANADTDGEFNRQRLLSTLFGFSAFQPMGPNTQSGIPDRSGTYLLAWREQPAIDTQLAGGASEELGLTLYIMRLNVAQ